LLVKLSAVVRGLAQCRGFAPEQEQPPIIELEVASGTGRKSNVSAFIQRCKAGPQELTAPATLALRSKRLRFA
jgi:hypothetical protein